MLNLIILSKPGNAMNYGIGTYARHLEAGLINTGKVHVHVPVIEDRGHKEFTVEEKGKNLTYYYMPLPAELKDTGNYKSEMYVKYAGIIVSYLHDILSRISGAVLHVNHFHCTEIVKKIKENFNFPVVSVVHYTMWQFLLKGNQKWLDAIWSKNGHNNELSENDKNALVFCRDEKEFYHLADRIITVTGYMNDFIHNYYGIEKDKIHTVYNGIDLGTFKDYDEKSKNEIKQRWYIGENEKVILFNGRLDNQKGLYYLLEGFRELLRQNPNCRLFAVGDGSFKTYLKHSAEIWSKVSFTGYIDFGLIKQLYKIADIGIIPSVYDHCPYVALEMMLNKIPLVISNIEGLNEIFLPGLDCLVINPSYTKEGNLFFEKDEMAKNMYKLLNNAELANKLAENAYIKVTEKFSVERMVAETVEVYHAALKSG